MLTVDDRPLEFAELLIAFKAVADNPGSFTELEQLMIEKTVEMVELIPTANDPVLCASTVRYMVLNRMAQFGWFDELPAQKKSDPPG